MMTLTADALFDELRQSQLLKPEQFEALGSAERYRDAQTLAREIYRRGWLTKYQLGALLQGRSDRLTLGPYRILDKLGGGGMGQVFKAIQPRLNRHVALKVIRPELMQDPLAVRRFHREVQHAAKLVHPNIVTVFDAGEVEGTHFLVMEFVDGTDLTSMIRQHGPMPPAFACECIRQAALGLQHAHEQGLIHRDVKPSNLLITRSGAEGTPLVKLLDMGVARPQDESMTETANGCLTQTNAVVGTPDFMAPEQARDSRTAGPASDLYSLGATLYYLLCGQPPFPEGTAVEKLLKHQLDAPPPIASYRPDLPPGLAAIVHRLLAKNPSDRFRTAAELAAALEPFARGQVVPAPILAAIPLEGETPPPPEGTLADTTSPFHFDTELLPSVPAGSSLSRQAAVPDTEGFRGPKPWWLGVAAAGVLLVTAGLIVGIRGLRSKPTPSEVETSIVEDTKPWIKPKPPPLPPPRPPLPPLERLALNDAGLIAFVRPYLIGQSQAYAALKPRLQSLSEPFRAWNADPFKDIDRISVSLHRENTERFLIVFEGSFVTPQFMKWLENGSGFQEIRLPRDINNTHPPLYRIPNGQGPRLFTSVAEHRTVLLGTFREVHEALFKIANPRRTTAFRNPTITELISAAPKDSPGWLALDAPTAQQLKLPVPMLPGLTSLVSQFRLEDGIKLDVVLNGVEAAHVNGIISLIKHLLGQAIVQLPKSSRQRALMQTIHDQIRSNATPGQPPRAVLGTHLTAKQLTEVLLPYLDEFDQAGR